MVFEEASYLITSMKDSCLIDSKGGEKVNKDIMSKKQFVKKYLMGNEWNMVA